MLILMLLSFIGGITEGKGFFFLSIHLENKGKKNLVIKIYCSHDNDHSFQFDSSQAKVVLIQLCSYLNSVPCLQVNPLAASISSHLFIWKTNQFYVSIFQVCFTLFLSIVTRKNSLNMNMMAFNTPCGEVQKIPILLSVLQNLFSFFLFKLYLFYAYIFCMHKLPCVSCIYDKSSYIFQCFYLFLKD